LIIIHFWLEGCLLLNQEQAEQCLFLLHGFFYGKREYLGFINSNGLLGLIFFGAFAP
jgi:hypothetical protein